MEKRYNNQSISQKIDHSVRYYRVPTGVEKSTALNSLLEKIKLAPEKRYVRKDMARWVGWSVAAAAAVILAFFLFTPGEIHLNGGDNPIALRLSDSTRVVLAAGSQISQPGFNRRNRVKLRGEAYFEVEKGNNFQVLTSLGSVQVLGTRFLVSESEGILDVSCFEGKVEVSDKTASHLLKERERVMLKEGTASMGTLAEESHPALARFRESYVAAGLVQIIKDMEDFFGLKVSLELSETRYYTGSFDTGNADVALTLLCEPLGLRFTRDKNIVTIKK